MVDLTREQQDAETRARAILDPPEPYQDMMRSALLGPDAPAPNTQPATVQPVLQRPGTNKHRVIQKVDENMLQDQSMGSKLSIPAQCPSCQAAFGVNIGVKELPSFGHTFRRAPRIERVECENCGTHFGADLEVYADFPNNVRVFQVDTYTVPKQPVWDPATAPLGSRPPKPPAPPAPPPRVFPSGSPRAG